MTFPVIYSLAGIRKGHIFQPVAQRVQVPTRLSYLEHLSKKVLDIAAPPLWPRFVRQADSCSVASDAIVRFCRMARWQRKGLQRRKVRLRCPPVRPAEVDADVQVQIFG